MSKIVRKIDDYINSEIYQNKLSRVDNIESVHQEDMNISFNLELEKNKIVIIQITRSFDLYSNIELEYDLNQFINFTGEIKGLPLEINKLIKEYLKPTKVIELSLINSANNLLQISDKSINKNIVKKKFNLKLEPFENEEVYQLVNNHLPLVAAAYHQVLLKIRTYRDCQFKLSLMGTLLNRNLRSKVVSRGSFMYQDKFKTVFHMGLVGTKLAAIKY